MSVDLGDLVETLQRQIAVPGGFADAFPSATDDNLIGSLSDAFWEIRMLDMLTDWTEGDGAISPITGTTEIPRELQQLIVLYAAITIVTNELKALDTLFRAKAGPVEFETQKSGTLLKDILTELQRRRLVAEKQLFALGVVTDTYIDAVAERADGTYGGLFWVR